MTCAVARSVGRVRCRPWNCTTGRWPLEIQPRMVVRDAGPSCGLDDLQQFCLNALGDALASLRGYQVLGRWWQCGQGKTGVLRRRSGMEVEQTGAVTAIAPTGLPDHEAVPGLHLSRRRRIGVEGRVDPHQEALALTTVSLNPHVEGGHDR